MNWIKGCDGISYFMLNHWISSHFSAESTVEWPSFSAFSCCCRCRSFSVRWRFVSYKYVWKMRFSFQCDCDDAITMTMCVHNLFSVVVRWLNSYENEMLKQFFVFVALAYIWKHAQMCRISEAHKNRIVRCSAVCSLLLLVYFVFNAYIDVATCKPTFVYAYHIESDTTSFLGWTSEHFRFIYDFLTETSFFSPTSFRASPSNATERERKKKPKDNRITRYNIYHVFQRRADYR